MDIADVQNHGVLFYCKHLYNKVFHIFPVYPRDGLPYSPLHGFIQQDSYPAFWLGISSL